MLVLDFGPVSLHEEPGGPWKSDRDIYKEAGAPGTKGIETSPSPWVLLTITEAYLEGSRPRPHGKDEWGGGLPRENSPWREGDDISRLVSALGQRMGGDIDLIMVGSGNEHCWVFLINLTINLPYKLASPVLGIYPRQMKTWLQKDLFKKNHSRFIHKWTKTRNIPNINQQENWQTNGGISISWIECYSAKRRNKPQCIIWVGLENIRLKETCTAGLNLYNVLEQKNYVLLEKNQYNVFQGEVKAV